MGTIERASTRDLSRRISIGLLLGAGVLVPALEERASARSVSAASGAVFYPGDAGVQGVSDDCLSFNYGTGAVTSSCSTVVIVPLTTDNAGTKNLHFTGSTPSGSPQWRGACQAIAWDEFGTSVSSSGLVDVHVGASYQMRTTPAVAVPGGGTFYARCSVLDGTRLSEFDYEP